MKSEELRKLAKMFPESYASAALNSAADYSAKLEAVVKAARYACSILEEVAKAVHIDWPDDVSSQPGYGKDTAVQLRQALAALDREG